MKYVIIGASAAGISAAEAIRKSDKKADIVVVSDEAFPLYSRCLLTYLIAGAITEEELYFKNKDFYEANNIRTYLGKKALSLNAEKKIVSLDDGTELSYDKLLIATGATPKSVDIPGIDKKGVFTVRKLEDARAILKMLERVREVAVLGGGLIGLRDAYALCQKQKQVTVVVKSPQILSQMVDKEAAGMLAVTLEKKGIKIRTHLAAKEILGKDSAEGILLDNGKRLPCQLVIIGKGVRPNTELASCAGLKVESGIVVDEYLRTSNKDIFAAGDVAETYDIVRNEKRINALWPCAVEQGKIAGLNMAGKRTAYEGSLSMNSVDFFGVGSISMGLTQPTEEGYEIITRKGKNRYKKFVLRNNRIVGAVFLGDIKSAGIVATLIKNKVEVSDIKHILAEDNFDYAKIMPLVKSHEDKFKEDEYKSTTITL